MFISKISQNLYRNTLTKDDNKEFREHFQDPTRYLLTQKSNLFVGARISNRRLINFCTKKCEIIPNNAASFKF